MSHKDCFIGPSAYLEKYIKRLSLMQYKNAVCILSYDEQHFK